MEASKEFTFDDGESSTLEDRWSPYTLFSSISYGDDDDNKEDSKQQQQQQGAQFTTTTALLPPAEDEHIKNDHEFTSKCILETDPCCESDEYHSMMAQTLFSPSAPSPTPASLSGSTTTNTAAAYPDEEEEEEDEDGKPAASAQSLHSVGISNARLVQVVPQKHDVLFGRSKRAKIHPGNQMLRALCDGKRKMYDLADRDDKTEITRTIAAEIKSNGGTFLKFDKQHKAWIEVTSEEAHHKVAHSMRDGRPQPLGRLEPEMFPPVQ